MTLADVLLHPSEYDGETIGEPWKWLIHEDFSILHVTVLGNFFLLDAQGRVWLLDGWTGQLHGVSQSYEQYKHQVATDTEFFRSWFLADLVEALSVAGLQRKTGEVFSPFVSPGIGGTLSAENFSLAPLSAYVATSAAEAKNLQRQNP